MAKEEDARQIDTHAKKRANNFMAVLGVAADISAVAALIFNKDLTLFVQIASVAGLAVGVYLLLRQWGKPVGVRVLFAVVCVTAGSVVGALALMISIQSVTTTTSNSPGTSSSTSGQTGQSGGASSGSTSNANGAAFQFRLEPYQGIDLDAGKHAQSDVVVTDGPNGNVDIFMTQFGYLTVNGGSFYPDTGGPDSDIHSRCNKALDAQRNPEAEVLPQKVSPVCFKTSAGKMGWLRANDTALTGQMYAVLNVQVW